MESSAGSSKSIISHLTYPKLDKDDTKDKTKEPTPDMEKRLWLGNLDPKLTEFHLLKLVQKYGTIEHFDFLFHRSGPNLGLPRGYAFVEYTEIVAAEKCMRALDGKRILDRHLAIRWAHQAVKEYPDEQTKLKAKLPALAVSESLTSNLTKEKAINAIEAKLRAMEHEKDQLTIVNSQGQGSHKPSTSGRRGEVNNYSNFRPLPQSQQPMNRFRQNNNDRHNRKPYSR